MSLEEDPLSVKPCDENLTPVNHCDSKELAHAIMAAEKSLDLRSAS